MVAGINGADSIDIAAGVGCAEVCAGIVARLASILSAEELEDRVLLPSGKYWSGEWACWWSWSSCREGAGRRKEDGEERYGCAHPEARIATQAWAMILQYLPKRWVSIEQIGAFYL